MARRAEWRASAGDPRTVWGWFARDGAYRRLPLSVGVAAMPLLGILAVGWSPWAALLLPLVALHVRLPGRRGDLAALATVPPPGPAFACHVEIREGGVPLGEDEGVLTFVRGWAHFAGRRTEFSLRRADVAGVGPRFPFPFGVWRPGPSASERRIVLVQREGTTLTFVPTGAWSGTDYFEDRLPVREGFEGAFRFWGSEAPEVRGEPTLPPRTLHPSGLARAWREFSLAYGAIGVGMFAVHLVARHEHWTSFLAFAFMEPMGRLMEAYRKRRRERKALVGQTA